MTKRNLMAMLLAVVLCLCWLAGCAGPSAEGLSGETLESHDPAGDSSDYTPKAPEPDEKPDLSGRPLEEVIAAIDEACEMEPFFCATDDIMLLWPETDDATRNSLEPFIGGWGVVLSDGTLVLNEAHFHTIYYDNGQPKEVDYESKDHTATVVVGLELPEEWRGLTITVIAPMGEGYPYYIGTGLPRILPSTEASYKYDGCGLWYWQEDRYVRVFEGVDHGETFSFDPATVDMV